MLMSFLVPNPSATQFVPLSDKKDENSAMSALLVTSLVLSAFFTSKLFDISNKNKTDDASPKKMLSNLRKNNVNKIIIGHLNDLLEINLNISSISSLNMLM